MATGKTKALTRQIFVGKVMSLLFNMLSRLVITFLPRSKHLLISWLPSMGSHRVGHNWSNLAAAAAVTICSDFIFYFFIFFCSDFRASKTKVSHCFHCFPIYLPWSDGTGCHDLHFFECWALSQLFVCSFAFIKRLFSSSSLSAVRVVSSAYLRLYAISPSNLDSSLSFIWPSISHDVLCI